MLKFSAFLELMNVESKTSKKGNNFIVLTFLSEDNKTFDVLYRGDSLNFASLEFRQAYEVQFTFNTIYSSLSVETLKRVELDDPNQPF